MRFLIIGIIVLIGMAFSPIPNDTVLIHRFIVQPSSRLMINGKTNVNAFQCATMSYHGKDTLVLIEGEHRRPFFEKGYVGLDASSFDCGMKIMTSDFGKTIKAKQFPSIFIEFISFERIPVYSNAKDKFKGKMKISLGGVTQTFQMDCTIEPGPSGDFHLKGGRSFSFSDFKLEPPQRVMGLVKVQDTLDVNFHLVLLLDKDW
jgi:hypothetical protein